MYFVAKEQQDIVLQAMEMITQDTLLKVEDGSTGEIVYKTCVSFRERTPEDEKYLVVQYGDGCFAVCKDL